MKLLHACLGDNLKGLLESPDPHDYTSLVIHKAARRENCGDFVTYLVKTFEFNVNVERARGGMGAMHIAASRNCRKLIFSLNKLGGNPNVSAANSVHTPIHRGMPSFRLQTVFRDC